MHAIPVRINGVAPPPPAQVLAACEAAYRWNRAYPAHVRFTCQLEPEQSKVMSNPQCTFPITAPWPKDWTLVMHGLSCPNPAYADYTRNIVFQTTSGVFDHEAGHLGPGSGPMAHTSGISGPWPMPRDWTGAKRTSGAKPTRTIYTYPNGTTYTITEYDPADVMGQGSFPLVAAQALPHGFPASNPFRIEKDANSRRWYVETTPSGNERWSSAYGQGALVYRGTR